MKLTDVVEEMDLFLLCEEGGANAVYRSISPSLLDTIRSPAK